MNFYKDLATKPDFESATRISDATDIPDDWCVVVADIQGSTAALREGRYKDVNASSVAAIAAIMNVDRNVALPFVFGGDGATAAVPLAMKNKVCSALLGARKLAQDAFKLNMRVGIVPVHAIKAEGRWLKIAKYRSRGSRVQACFLGRGWDFVEKIIKSEEGAKYLVDENSGVEADASFEGFECRWEPINRKFDVIVSLVVQSLSSDAGNHMAVYNQVLDEILRVYRGFDQINPVSVKNLRLSLKAKVLRQEMLVRAYGSSWLGKNLYRVKMLVQNLVVRFAMRFQIKLFNVNWNDYRESVPQNTDFCKFDGSLKMIIDSKQEQLRRLKKVLDELQERRQIAYGISLSDFSVMTCIVLSHVDEHMHFVDGGNGGYAQAATEMKSALSAAKK